MSQTATTDTAKAAPEAITLTVDGKAVSVAKGTNVLEAAKQVGVDISAFCYHPGLSIAACCRQCLVSIEKNPKLQPSCQTIAAEGMVVHTQDAQSKGARKQMLEFTLVNHPIDCPICDKAGECSLQKLYFENDNAASRVDTPKVHKPKVVDLGPTVILDAERCILCTRCIRTCDEVAGVHQLDMIHRGDHEEITTAPGQQLDNPYSMNVVDVCPVGALTAKDFRFTMRAWELSMTPTVCNGCSTGCNIELHHKDDRAWRIVPRENQAVNKYWMCDDGRFTYHELREHRLAAPLVDGLPASWDKALNNIAATLKAAPAGSVAVVLSAIASNEDNFALAKLAGALGAGLYVSARPAVPGRADDKLRSADVNANTTGVTAIAHGLGKTLASQEQLQEDVTAGKIGVVVSLGDVLKLAPGSAKLFALSAHERGAIKHAAIALPIAAWAELDGTVTNDKGMIQRMHPALAAPGTAIMGWEAVSRIATACGHKLAWASSREVFKDMTSAIAGFASSTGAWGKAVRSVQLRFANSRG